MSRETTYHLMAILAGSLTPGTYKDAVAPLNDLVLDEKKALEVDPEVSAALGPGSAPLVQEPLDRPVLETVIQREHQGRLHNGAWNRPAR